MSGSVPNLSGLQPISGIRSMEQMNFQERLSSMHGMRTFNFPAGRISVSSPLRIGPEFSGCVFHGDGTVFDAGTPVTEWTPSGELWIAPLPAGHRFLYRNGAMLPNSRWPAKGVLSCAEWDSEQKSETMEWVRNRMHVKLEESVRKDAADAEIVLYFGWQCCRLRGFRIDPEGIDLPFDTNMYHASACDFVFENMPETYLSPGQWHPDPEKKRILYKPLPGEKPEDAEFSSGGTDRILILDGAERVTFEGITFRNTGDSAIRNSHQADHRNTGCIELRNAKHCSFRKCRFESLSCWGADLLAGSTDNLFTECEFRHLGSGAVKMSGGHADEPPDLFCGRNTVERCVIAHGGLRWSGCTALLIRHSGGNMLLDNDISEFPYSGISCGWSWGYAPSPARDNRIERNRIHDLGRDQLVLDMGGIYLLGAQPGTVIADNRVWNVQGRFFCWGIYLDEGAAGVTISGNLVYNCKNEPFRVHFGKHNLVTDNVFIARRGSACCAITRGTMDRNENAFIPGDKVFDFSRNLCISDGMPFYLRYLLEIPGKQETLDTWSGDENWCFQTDPSCKVKFCEDWHYINKTFREIPDSEFIAPGRDLHSHFFSGSVPTAEDLSRLCVPEKLVRLYRESLEMGRAETLPRR